ncbi:H-2 class I histocompatibility antigen, Q9 alpha chain-like isoform X2 [Neoarius graeffei]|uniref:H-2 class I histocompatibility antigen, Q9 alpha chain-like isoform X2 n=1 Tax=Neoarius graeffei TaxID=443677 RepID=UPI00298CBC9E|nr:H-2 class I histocompatibility antigen, Q9 alpha chain-like isoform X2 [Neoarius graeffei]XP_060763816.1 H-2 class I histocompatibility antigen, Q9 alpha chain-like isoform X2 [Neoarius graeffei]
MGHGLGVLLFLTVSLHLSSAVSHSLQYFYTGVRGINFPEFTEVGLVDGEQFSYYDSIIRRVIPKAEWIQKVNTDDPDYWNRQTQVVRGTQELFKANMATVMQRFNHTAGVHTVQEMVGCELDDDGTTRGYSQFGYDGEDFISLDLKTLTWTAAKPQALITKHKWEKNPGDTVGRKNYLENICIEWLKKYVSYGRETLERKVRPEASVFHKRSPSPEVVCHATGFFPKAVMITWQKDGEDLIEDVELTETLPNQDGSFQKRSILKVPAEELQRHKYTCVVQHSSLGEGKDLVLPVSERRILRGGGWIAIIIGVLMALVALITVVAAVVFLKKAMFSGFGPVPSKPWERRWR